MEEKMEIDTDTNAIEVSDSDDVTFQIVSDLHLEFPNVIRELPSIPVLSPILCLLGDIGYPNDIVYKEFLKFHSSLFQHIIVITGNHEYYKQDSYQHANEEIADFCRQYTNIHFLNQSEFMYKDTVFLGCTLWPNVPTDHIDYIQYLVNDYRAIKYLVDESGNCCSNSKDGKNSKTLTVEQTNRWHIDQVQWLKDQIAKYSDKKIVILTHHAPSNFNCLWPGSSDERQKYMQFDDLENMMGGNVKLWCFGHTHWSSDYIRNGTRVVSNQAGYILFQVNGIKGSNRYEVEKVLSIKESEKLIDEWKSSGKDPLWEKEQEEKRKRENETSASSGWSLGGWTFWK